MDTGRGDGGGWDWDGGWGSSRVVRTGRRTAAVCESAFRGRLRVAGARWISTGGAASAEGRLSLWLCLHGGADPSDPCSGNTGGFVVAALVAGWMTLLLLLAAMDLRLWELRRSSSGSSTTNCSLPRASSSKSSNRSAVLAFVGLFKVLEPPSAPFPRLVLNEGAWPRPRGTALLTWWV